FFFFQAEDGIRDFHVTGVQTCALPISVARAVVEIWQCDANGVYLHPGDRGPRDQGFQGYGRTVTDGGGSYRFRTIRPVAYGGRRSEERRVGKGRGARRCRNQQQSRRDQ